MAGETAQDGEQYCVRGWWPICADECRRGFQIRRSMFRGCRVEQNVRRQKSGWDYLRDVGNQNLRHTADWTGQQQNGPQLHARTAAKGKAGQIDFVRIHGQVLRPRAYRCPDQGLPIRRPTPGQCRSPRQLPRRCLPRIPGGPERYRPRADRGRALAESRRSASTLPTTLIMLMALLQILVNLAYLLSRRNFKDIASDKRHRAPIMLRATD